MKHGAAKHSEEAVQLVAKDLETAQYWTSKDYIANEDVFKIPAWKLPGKCTPWKITENLHIEKSSKVHA